MATEIPILNIYYLLCYAWDKLEEGQTIDISHGECHNLSQLFARILSSGTQHLVRRGFERGYIHYEEDTARIRGRLDVTASMSQLTWQRGTMVCEFDELSHDILHNRILKTTIGLLLRTEGLGTGDRQRLLDQAKILRDITPVRITSSLFRRVRTHRNNRYYKFLLHVCELIHHSLLPTEQDGKTRFRDFTRDPGKMASLFEKFVKNFYHREQEEFRVGAIQFPWIKNGSPEAVDLVPGLNTDVSLISHDRSIILDCKFYGNAIATTQHGTKTFQSGNLFQLYAYLRNVRVRSGWENTEGILLYPVTGEAFDHRFELDGYPVRVTCVDLNQPWQSIHDTLLGVLDSQPRE